METLNRPVNTNGAKSIEDFEQIRKDYDHKESFLKQVFREKAPDYTEIEISFFQLCHMHCSFCWQDTYDPGGTQNIVEKAQTVVNYLIQKKSSLKKEIQVHLLGGELFEDRNDYYSDYFEFIQSVQDHAQKFLEGHNLKFVFLTNMNFQEDSTLNKLETFLTRLESINTKVVLTTSWDPTGRPLKGETSTKFHHNINYFKKYVSEITFVLTRPTIKKLLSGNTPYLDLLINEGFTVEYDYYMPTNLVDKLMPSDRDLLNAFRVLIKKYPSIPKLKQWADPEWDRTIPTRLTCASLNKITILPDGTITNCRHLSYSPDEFETEIKNESNSDMMMNFISKKECLSCEFFQECPLSCFLMSDHKKYNGSSSLDECLYKTLFRERN
jgi:radical SAM protein with 4Fe4S-binding SPASM domain